MLKKRSKIIVVLGQTATGKSDLAVKIAKKNNGEVISADSRQVYRGLDIGSGKITKKEMAGVPHHLIDVVRPKKTFSVAHFQKLALKKIEQVLRRGHVPIIVGGTGFYIDSILYDVAYPPLVVDQKFRKSLQKKPASVLYKILLRLDPKRARAIDKNNPRRLIRAIEIARSFGAVPEFIKQPRPDYDFLLVGLAPHPQILKAKIKYRLLKRMRVGMIKEVKNLRESGVSWKRLYDLGLEYRYVSLYLRGKISRAEMIEGLASAIWKYAKRQQTWFKRDKRIHWYDPNKKTDLQEIGDLVRKFLI